MGTGEGLWVLGAQPVLNSRALAGSELFRMPPAPAKVSCSSEGDRVPLLVKQGGGHFCPHSPAAQV